ncbi:uncharacterized protein TRAVEDRAFT_49625 [Trametes versicolor FP-101664 SS1]|uniref:uncharacterized protein n=1 Tax=Trametes versicolor (strain FP-101664) TaxID=717944 RepID=UPI00046229E4|nr:uncharacterized protein TRAVEDRAFT_49625 [Trametes versicolor FP-101664 SS1]EIW56803.1 hypothetical protein TRAVEDRAFT_49625 [Trametes versicolor FP-101664 SS1]
MSSPNAAFVEEVIAVYQEATTAISLSIVITVMLVYDVLLTSGKEYQYIWRSPKSWFSRVLYLWNRYMCLLNNVMVLGTIPSMSDTQYVHCAHPSNDRFIVASRGSQILVDLLAAATTWRKTRATIQLRTGVLDRPSLEQVMWKNGMVYFCVLCSLNVLDVVLFSFSLALAPISGGSSYALQFIDPIVSILNSRFLLALHETNMRLGGNDTSISSLSFNAGSQGNPREGSPELPEFLGIIGGPIHSFHGDEDPETLEFALPSQEEVHQCEHELAEIVESGRDGGDVA